MLVILIACAMLLGDVLFWMVMLALFRMSRG